MANPGTFKTYKAGGEIAPYRIIAVAAGAGERIIGFALEAGSAGVIITYAHSLG